MVPRMTAKARADELRREMISRGQVVIDREAEVGDFGYDPHRKNGRRGCCGCFSCCKLC
jgi:hypothetical protein